MPNIYPIQPTTVTVNWGSTGDKTLLQITDNLPAGNKIVLFALGWDSASNIAAQGYLKIVSGGTTLVQEGITHSLNLTGTRPKPVMLFAYHANAPENAQYTFIATVTTASSGSSTLHVQGMVILLTSLAFFTTGSNTNIAAGATVTLATVNTNFPAGSKVAVLAYVQMGVTSTTGAHRIYQAGNIRILAGSTIVSQNQFQVGTYSNLHLALVSLSYLDTLTSNNPSYSIQVYNSLSEASLAWGEIVAFRVVDGAFLDTASVALTNGSQVTVGNLSTSLNGEVGVIALAAAENTGTADVEAFNAGDVVLQLNNQSTGQVANQRGWFLQRTSYQGRSGVYALFRVDSYVSSPSYQVKMTARADGINGEAKILAFIIIVPTLVSVSDSGVGSEAVGVNVNVPVSDSGVGGEVSVVSISSSDSGVGGEVVGINVNVPVSDSSVGGEVVSINTPVYDGGIGSEDIGRSIEVNDSGAGLEVIDLGRGVDDTGLGVDTVIAGLSATIGDVGVGSDTVDITGSVYVDDAGYGVDDIGVQASVLIDDFGAGVDVVSVGLQLVDTGVGVDDVDIRLFLDDFGVGSDAAGLVVNVGVDDFGAGVDAVFSPQFNVSVDSGVGVDYVVDIISAADSGVGGEVVGLLVTVGVVDSGVGADVAERLLSIFGVVFIDGVDVVGRHSIPYSDLKRRGLPIQTVKRTAADGVFVGGDEVGYVVVEWEDKVSDISSGFRRVIVTGLVSVND